MEETFMLIALVIVMLIGSFVAGSIPLVFTLSEVIFHFNRICNVFKIPCFQDKLTKITAFGAGLLVGTALIVIIPEGVRSLITEAPPVPENETDSHQHSDNLAPIGISLILGFIFMLLVDQVTFLQLN